MGGSAAGVGSESARGVGLWARGRVEGRPSADSTDQGVTSTPSCLPLAIETLSQDFDAAVVRSGDAHIHGTQEHIWPHNSAGFTANSRKRTPVWSKTSS